MRLLVLDSAADAEVLAESLRDCERCEVVRRDPDESVFTHAGESSGDGSRSPGDEAKATAKATDEDKAEVADPDMLHAVLVRRTVLEERAGLQAWLVQERARGTAVILLVDDMLEIESASPEFLERVDDFALMAASPFELRTRARRSARHRQQHLRAAQEIADASVRRAFASKLIHAQEAERHLLSKELHDGVGQMMMVHLMDADLLASQTRDGPLHELAERLCTSLESTLRSVRDLALDLRPPAIDELGIEASLESLVTTLGRRSGLRFEYSADAISGSVPSDVKVALYRIAQAAIDNALHHSRCDNIKVALERVGTGLQLTVIDDGIGFDLKRESSSTWLGLVGMRERADAIGGHVTIDSTIDHGTIVTVVVPEILESARE